MLPVGQYVSIFARCKKYKDGVICFNCKWRSNGETEGLLFVESVVSHWQIHHYKYTALLWNIKNIQTT